MKKKNFMPIAPNNHYMMVFSMDKEIGNCNGMAWVNKKLFYIHAINFILSLNRKKFLLLLLLKGMLRRKKILLFIPPFQIFDFCIVHSTVESKRRIVVANDDEKNMKKEKRIQMQTMFPFFVFQLFPLSLSYSVSYLSNDDVSAERRKYVESYGQWLF